MEVNVYDKHYGSPGYTDTYVMGRIYDNRGIIVSIGLAGHQAASSIGVLDSWNSLLLYDYIDTGWYLSY